MEVANYVNEVTRIVESAKDHEFETMDIPKKATKEAQEAVIELNKEILNSRTITINIEKIEECARKAIDILLDMPIIKNY